ncbi:MAG: universal stress protein [Burkholderiales bacterium]|nr:universal stress protein [Burkholderiales bacterium]
MNAIRSILVHVDGTSASAVRVAVAREFAAQHSAVVTALYAVTRNLLPVPFMDALPSVEKRRNRARAIFHEALQAPGCSATWTELEGDSEEIGGFVRHAFCCDLLVLGQHMTGDVASHDVPANFTEAVMIDSGKPAIIVPHSRKTAGTGRRIVIAWKSTRESARAVACAMPLLRAASRVHLIHWRESDDDVHSLDDIERHLRLHDVEAMRDEVVRANSGVGDAIVSFAIDVGADLIVMGCYGHRRLREIVLRGATTGSM